VKEVWLSLPQKAVSYEKVILERALWMLGNEMGFVGDITRRDYREKALDFLRDDDKDGVLGPTWPWTTGRFDADGQGLCEWEPVCEDSLSAEDLGVSQPTEEITPE
jgi:hypothetical protein